MRELLAYVTVEIVFATIVVLVCLAWARRYRRDIQSKIRREIKNETNARIENQVRQRTQPLETTVSLYKIFVENTDAIAFEYDLPNKHLTYIAPQVTTLLSSTSNRSRREFLGTLIHRDDRARVFAALHAYAAGSAREATRRDAR